MELLRRGLASLCDADAAIQKYIGRHIDEIIVLLERYIAEIELFNPAYALVSYKERDELIIRHILDSLAPLKYIIRALTERARERPGPDKNTLRIADAGSGAGLPGVPLAIALQFFNDDLHCAIQCTLIEKMERRADFLRNVRAVLPLKNVEIEQCEIKHAPCGAFDIITFRAFKPLTQKSLKELVPRLKAGGILAAWKGRLEKINDEMRQIEPDCGEWSALPCPVPFLEEARHLVLITGSKK